MSNFFYKLSLTFISLFAISAYAEIPTFNLMSGKSSYLTVGEATDGSGRVSITLWQNKIGSKSTLVSSIETALELPTTDADRVEFLLPANACQFPEKALLRCDDSKLTGTQFQQREVILRRASSGDSVVLKISGKDLPANALRIHFWLDKTTRTSAFDDYVNVEHGALFSARVWLFRDSTHGGWASVDDVAFNHGIKE